MVGRRSLRDLVPPYGLSESQAYRDETQAMTVSPDLPRSAEQTPPPPKLLIDFGCDPRVGVNLQLKFFVVCPGFASKPLVTVRLDRRLDQQDWKSVPQISQEDQANWTFDEPLRTTSEGKDCRPGTYSLEVRMVFHEGAGEPVCFRGRLGISVPDPAQPQAGPTLEIEGAEKAAVNLMGRDLSEFSKVVVKVGADGVANIQEKLYPDTGTPARSKNCVADLQLKRDRELEPQLPRRGTLFSGRAKGRRRAAAGRRAPHPLVARSPVLLGRERRDSQGRQTNDITLRLWSRASKLYRRPGEAGVPHPFAYDVRAGRAANPRQVDLGFVRRRAASRFAGCPGGQRPAGPVAGRGRRAGTGDHLPSRPGLGHLARMDRFARAAVLPCHGCVRIAALAGCPGAGLDAVRIRRSRRLPDRRTPQLLGRCLSPKKFEAMRRMRRASICLTSWRAASSMSWCFARRRWAVPRRIRSASAAAACPRPMPGSSIFAGGSGWRTWPTTDRSQWPAGHCRP